MVVESLAYKFNLVYKLNLVPQRFYIHTLIPVDTYRNWNLLKKIYILDNAILKFFMLTDEIIVKDMER